MDTVMGKTQAPLKTTKQRKGGGENQRRMNGELGRMKGGCCGLTKYHKYDARHISASTGGILLIS
jgi:hypothetical protein